MERVVVTGETGEWSGDELVALSILVVFLCLAALYESWSVPISVILVIPLGVLGAALAASLRGLSNDVYFQVALLTTIGLSSKNAILIVEFAEAKVAEGYSLTRAALRAAQTRLRPIIMTSLAFIARGNTAGRRHRCRRQQPRGDWDRHHRRDARGNAAGHLLCSIILRTGETSLLR